MRRPVVLPALLALLSVNCSDPNEPSLETGGSSGAPSAVAGAGGIGGTPAAMAGNTSSGGAPAQAGTSSGGASAGESSTAGTTTGGGGAATAGGGAAAGAPSVMCPAGAIFCDDFESYAEGTPPSGKWKTWTVGNGKLVVDAQQGFSGTKAAHFHGKVSQSGGSKEQAFMLAEGAPAFPVSGTTLYVRFMLYSTRFPFTGFSDPNHIALAWVGSSKALNSPDRGATNEGYMLADYNGVSIEPMWSGYYRDTSRHFKDANQANAWRCWEFEIDNAGGPPAGAKGVALPHIWQDGVELKLSPAGNAATSEYAAIPFEAVMFALWSPQTDTSAADYWIDDVAVSKTRINCPPAK